MKREHTVRMKREHSANDTHAVNSGFALLLSERLGRHIAQGTHLKNSEKSKKFGIW